MHRRAPETTQIPIEDIWIDPADAIDPHIAKTYVALERGKIKAALTRMPNAEIHSGFYVRQSGGSVEHFTNVRADGVAMMEVAIRSGMRPTLDLLWSPHAPEGGGYVCADDEAALAAYRKLDIKNVPCRILRPIAKPGPEAAIWVENKAKYVVSAKSVPPVVDFWPSYLGNEEEMSPSALNFLREEIDRVAMAIKNFHRRSGYNVHYHEMLYAFVRRHDRSIDSICKMFELNRVEHAMALLRVSYEAFLNFYLDWLSPQFFGPRFQLISTLRRSQIDESDSSWRVVSNFPGLLENVANKARLSPLGGKFHDGIYPELSLVVHQSYGNLETESVDFHDEFLPQSEYSISALVRCLDVLTAAILSRVSNDVGAI